MRSTFMGLETARRGMFTQQSALHTTGHNIANANTPGYTRQRVNFVQTSPYPAASMNRPQMPGQFGTGVEAGSIERVREGFLDVQFRSESNKFGYWQARADSLQKLEEVMHEPSDTGLSETMNEFWQGLQDLAVNPQNPGARSVVRQRGIALSETFQYLNQSLTSIQTDLKNEIGVTESKLNSILYQISQVNKQIGEVEPHGYLPNDLYDERSRLIDELSTFANIKVEYTEPDGSPSALAEGQATISLVDDNGGKLAEMVNGGEINKFSADFSGVDGSVKSVMVGNTSIDFTKSQGKLKALIDSFGYDSNGKVEGVYPKMLEELDNLAYTFATEFNKVHEANLSPNEIANGEKAIPFFNVSGDRKGYAGRMAVAKEILENIDNIATAAPANPYLGDSQGVLDLANVINNQYAYSGGSEGKANFRNYYEGVIGEMAVLSQQAERLSYNSGSLMGAVENRRQSVSAVSLDEEMSNMIQFQHAYNASARMISLTDELLDKIINGMGTGGR
ncbi:flagellar hook-associated protein FlgK [Bacillus massilinigeriensis]|uniref:flagellar hook-associated protein FlgK n=1 Tax=Bacillus mediterraneensis TaxID=1805474 RepID=UPI0008F873C5|nr:flagellar hook-associated protein FlgK [Bacillus mediterraneensis]